MHVFVYNKCIRSIEGSLILSRFRIWYLEAFKHIERTSVRFIFIVAILSPSSIMTV
jgi:hypothetical protein